MPSSETAQLLIIGAMRRSGFGSADWKRYVANHRKKPTLLRLRGVEWCVIVCLFAKVKEGGEAMTTQDNITAAIAGIRSRLETLASITESNILIPDGSQERYHAVILSCVVMASPDRKSTRLNSSHT